MSYQSCFQRRLPMCWSSLSIYKRMREVGGLELQKEILLSTDLPFYFSPVEIWISNAPRAHSSWLGGDSPEWLGTSREECEACMSACCSSSWPPQQMAMTDPWWMDFRVFHSGSTVSEALIPYPRCWVAVADYHNPSPSQLGLLNCIMSVGSICAIPFVPYTADILGRRTGVMIGCTIMVSIIGSRSARPIGPDPSGSWEVYY